MKNIKFYCAALAIPFLASCHKQADTKPTPADNKVYTTIANATMLGTPVAEAKVYKLIKGYDSGDDFEASGVYYLNGYFYVAFDNRYKIGKIKSTLPENSNNNTLLSSGSGSSNFEGISYDSRNDTHFFVVEESVSHNGAYYPRIRQYDASMNYTESMWVDYAFTSANSNKAFEGIAWTYRDGDDYMLGLVEGTGKVPVFKKTSSKWVFITEISLPSSVTFNDYSDIALYGNKVAITSQEDGQLWIGTLSDTDWSITGGKAYSFPTGSAAGVVGAGSYPLYGNIEGVSFISDTQIVVVSDKVKSDQPAYQQTKDQSVHIFNLN